MNEVGKAYIVLFSKDEKTYIAELENAEISTEPYTFGPVGFSGPPKVVGEIKIIREVIMPFRYECEDIPDEEILNLIQEG